MKKISKILAANRSEIAILIFRASEESGIKTAAIYSKEDRFAIHRFNKLGYCDIKPTNISR